MQRKIKTVAAKSPALFIHLKISSCFNCFGSTLGELLIAIPEPMDADKIAGLTFKELVSKSGVRFRFRYGLKLVFFMPVIVLIKSLRCIM